MRQATPHRRFMLVPRAMPPRGVDHSAQLVLPGFDPRPDRFEWRELDPRYVLRESWRRDPSTAPPVPAWFEPSAEALAAADGYPGRLGPYVARLLRGDPTERIAQLARAAPGVLVFLHALHRAGLDGFARRLIRRVQGGEPLSKILEDAAHACCSRSTSHVAGWRHALVGAQCTPAAHRRQRLLVLRAGPQVRPALLVTSFPRVFVPEDIPLQPSANRRWYDVMSPEQDLQHVTESVEAAVYRFASCHADALHAVAGGPRRVMSHLLEFCAATNRHPARNTDLSGLIEELCTWDRHQARDRIVRARCDGFPPPPLSGYEGDSSSILPIATPNALIAEGTDLGHCVASRAGSVLRGVSYFYAVRVGTARSTLEIRRGRCGWVPAEHRGPRDTLPSDDECRAVARWLASYRNAPRPFPSPIPQ